MIHIAVGSNIDPEIHVPSGIERMRGFLEVLAVSPFYVVPAIDRPDQPDYWNGIVAVDADGGIRDLLRSIEDAEGRVRTDDKWAARTLDLDILLIDGILLDPDLHARPFLIHCLADLRALPTGFQDPGDKWPIGWDGQTED